MLAKKRSIEGVVDHASASGRMAHWTTRPSRAVDQYAPSPESEGRWPGNVVRYYIDPIVSPDHSKGINGAIAIYQRLTPLG